MWTCRAAASQSWSRAALLQRASSTASALLTWPVGPSLHAQDETALHKFSQAANARLLNLPYSFLCCLDHAKR